MAQEAVEPAFGDWSQACGCARQYCLLTEAGLRFRSRHALRNLLADPHIGPVVRELLTAVQTHDVSSRSAFISPRRQRKRGPVVRTTEKRVENRLEHAPRPPSD